MNNNILTIMHEEDYLKNKSNVDINATDKYGHNALYQAPLEKIEWLIKNGININNINNVGRNILFYVAAKKIPFFVAHGADINVRDNEGLTVFHNINCYQKIKAIVDAGFCFKKNNDLSNLGFKETRSLISLLPLETIKDLKLNLQILSNRGKSLLFDLFDIEKMKYLISQGVDVNQLDYQKNTVFLCSPNEDTIECLRDIKKLLICSGLDVDHINKAGRNLMYYEKDPVIQDLLLSKMSLKTLNCQCKQYKRTCLFFADDEKSKKLIQAGIDVNIRSDKHTPAFKTTNSEEVQLLMLENGLKINETDSSGRNLFFYQSINERIIKELLIRGGDMNLLTSKKENALCFQNIENQKVLLKLGICLDTFFKNPQIFNCKDQEFKDMVINENILREKEILRKSMSDFSVSNKNNNKRL